MRKISSRSRVKASPPVTSHNPEVGEAIRADTNGYRANVRFGSQRDDTVVSAHRSRADEGKNCTAETG
jgi:hypothetical protein